MTLLELTTEERHGVVITVTGDDLHGYKLIVEVGDEKNGRDTLSSGCS